MTGGVCPVKHFGRWPDEWPKFQHVLSERRRARQSTHDASRRGCPNSLTSRTDFSDQSRFGRAVVVVNDHHLGIDGQAGVVHAAVCDFFHESLYWHHGARRE
jgi:hypothetical protein